MDFDTERPLDCGHVEPPAGVCQHQDCRNQMCNSCLADCHVGHNTLCPTHQYHSPDGTVVCPSHAPRYVANKLLTHVKNRL